MRTHFLCFLRMPPVVIFPKHSFINEAPGGLSEGTVSLTAFFLPGIYFAIFLSKGKHSYPGFQSFINSVNKCALNVKNDQKEIPVHLC